MNRIEDDAFHSDRPIALEAGLWFAYGRAKRADVTARTTFDAVLRGERSSTTRFLAWPGRDAWDRIAAGDLLRFNSSKDNSPPGRFCIVEVVSVQRIDIRKFSAAELEEWSRCEGWQPDKGLEYGRRFGPALWFHHRLVWPTRYQPRPPVQGSLW